MDRNIEGMIEIGRQNAMLSPQVKSWCEHLDIKQTSQGLLGQMTGLPMGLLEITCPHGLSTGSSMRLEWEAPRFILANCRDCTHHRELARDNYGRLIFVQEADSNRREAEEREAAQLALQVSLEEATAALETEEITEQSVNCLILAIQISPENREVASQRLRDAAKLGSMFFSPVAIEVMVKGFAAPYGAAYIDAVRLVLSEHNEFPANAIDALQSTLISRQHMQECAALVVHYIEGAGFVVGPELLSAIIDATQVDPDIPMLMDIAHKDRWPGFVRVISTLLTHQPDSIRSELQRRLRTGDDIARYNVVAILQALLPEGAEQVLQFVPDLLHALSLEDRGMAKRADGSTQSLLAHLYAYAPASVEVSITRHYSFLNNANRRKLLSIYDKLGRHGTYDHRSFSKAAYQQHVPVVIEKLYLAIADIQIEIGIRGKIASDLQSTIYAFPEEGIEWFPRIISRMVMVFREYESAKVQQAAVPGGGEVDGQPYQILISNLRQCIERIARYAPEATYSHLEKSILDLDSRTQGHIKSALVDCLEHYAAEYQLIPVVLPLLYKLMLDFDSNAVRATAIEAFATYMVKRPSDIPSDMLDLLFEVHLKDQYVVVHKAAIRAAGKWMYEGDTRGSEVFVAMVQYEHMYRLEKDFSFSEEVLRIIERRFKQFPKVRKYLATKVLPSYCELGKPRLTKKALAMQREYLGEFAEIEPQFVSSCLDYIRTVPPDMYIGSPDRERLQLIDSLSFVSLDVLKSKIGEVEKAIGTMLPRYKREASRLIRAVSRAGLHEEAERILHATINKLPQVKANAFWRETFRAQALAERAEIAVSQKSFDSAQASIREAIQVLSDLSSRG